MLFGARTRRFGWPRRVVQGGLVSRSPDESTRGNQGRLIGPGMTPTLSFVAGAGQMEYLWSVINPNDSDRATIVLDLKGVNLATCSKAETIGFIKQAVTMMSTHYPEVRAWVLDQIWWLSGAGREQGVGEEEEKVVVYGAGFAQARLLGFFSIFLYDSSSSLLTHEVLSSVRFRACEKCVFFFCDDHAAPNCPVCNGKADPGDKNQAFGIILCDGLCRDN